MRTITPHPGEKRRVIRTTTSVMEGMAHILILRPDILENSPLSGVFMRFRIEISSRSRLTVTASLVEDGRSEVFLLAAETLLSGENQRRA